MLRKIFKIFVEKKLLHTPVKSSEIPFLCYYLKPGIQEWNTECRKRRVGSGKRYIQGSVAKHSGECRHTLFRMLPIV